MDKVYDTAIIGGGLGGLTLSIQLVRAGLTVILLEKETYPYQKVCGEYISMESWDFLVRLGLPLDTMQLPTINTLHISSPSGNMLQSGLELGGFGISRYKIDNELKNIAVAAGVIVLENCKAKAPDFSNEIFTIKTNKGVFKSKVCCGSFGKRSNIDVRWNRKFVSQKNNKLNNYIGVKYHVQYTQPHNLVALHNFSGGYCGISKIEEDRYCLCYLTTAKNLQTAGSIERMEQNILSNNPHLREIFTNCGKINEQPVTISQISFDKKLQVENHVLMIGDAAGMITPLCGNGMSMAMHGGKIAAGHIIAFITANCSRLQMEMHYCKDWKKLFAHRLKTGRLVQSFFGKAWLSNIFIKVMKASPFLTKKLISMTHGESF